MTDMPTQVSRPSEVPKQQHNHAWSTTKPIENRQDPDFTDPKDSEMDVADKAYSAMDDFD